ncbi:protein Daple-like isoform X3 [Symsagittifera roscoffensis]|uniref:protein Daple-like isoform X3 n=1 Tax=Symsagittifera roscoffensis TaxID=84072 RepID=UPI00307CA1E0
MSSESPPERVNKNDSTSEHIITSLNDSQSPSEVFDHAEPTSDHSDSISETSSEPSIKVNPAFKKVLNNPKDLLPSSPFKKMTPSPGSDSLKSGNSTEDQNRTPRNTTGSSTITRHNNSNVEAFMKSSLVQWATRAIDQSYDSNGNAEQVTSPVRKGSDGNGHSELVVTFQELVDGILLNDLMYDIHPSIACKAGIQADVEEQPHLRLQNLALLLRNIRFYHAEVLGEALVGRLPDVTAIAREPSSVMGLSELKRVLQLLLGCAMKSEVPVRERHVSIIQSLPVAEQTELMEYIQEAKSNENAISLSAVEEHVHVDLQEIFHRLIDDRFDLFEICNSQAVEQLSGGGGGVGGVNGDATSSGGQPQLNGGGSGMWKRGSFHTRQGSNYGEIQQLNLQISDLKNRLMKKDNELNQKDEDLEAYSDETRNLSVENKKLKEQLTEAAREARSIRGLRDEVDIYREKAARADRAESELEMAKHKLEELDYYRQRLEQSNKDYKMLEETKSSIEKHMQALETQVELLHETQRENITLQSQITSLETQIEEKELLVDSLKKENQTLGVQNTASLNESASLHQQLVNANYTQTSHRPSVGSECEDTLKFSMIQLEKEKQELKTRAIEMETQLLQLSKEKAAVEKECDKWRGREEREKGTLEELQHNIDKAMNDKKALHETMEQLQQSHTSEITSLKEEIDSLTQNLESSRRQTSMNDSNMDSQLKEAQEQNIVLHARVQEFMSKCNQCESEKRQIQRKLEVLQEELNQKSGNDTKLQQLTRENEQLKENLEEEKTKSSDLEKVEKENLSLQIEISKFKSKLDQSSNVESQYDELKKDLVQLKTQNLKLTKQSENFNALTQKINQLELENSEKQREIETLQHVIQVNKSELSRATELEARNQALNNDIQKLRKTLEMYSEKEREKGDELSALQLEKESVQRELDTMRVNNETLEVKMKEMAALDNDNCQLVKDKRQLERNIERLKRDIEEYETKDQDQRSRLAVMERDLKRTQRFTERDLGKDEQIQELKNENAELRKQSMVDKKTNNCLREELVNEKLRHQDLQSEMEKVKGDLADKESNLKLQQHKNLLEQSSGGGSRTSSPNSSFNNGSLMISNSLLDVKDKRIKELESLLKQKSAEKDSIQQELEVLKKQLPKPGSNTTRTNQGVGGLLLPGLDDFTALDREHVRARERIESLTQQLDVRQSEMNELLSVKYRHEGQIEAYRKQLQKTHAETANIQVELSTLRSENASLKTQFADEQNHRTRLEHQLQVRSRDLDNAQSAYEQLLQGNEMLQALHSNLSHDYEDRMSQFTQLKNDHKKLSNNHRDLKEKYEVLKSEKDTLEKQNTSLKGQRDSLLTTTSSGKQQQSNGTSSFAELEERLENYKKSNSNLKMMNATLMEAFEKLKKERDHVDSKRTESRQRERENSELRSQVSNLHSFSEELETQNQKMKYDYELGSCKELLKSHNDQLSQMCIEYDALHEQLRSRQSRRPRRESHRSSNYHSANADFEVPVTTSETIPSLSSAGRGGMPPGGGDIEETTDEFSSQVRTPSLEHLDETKLRMREKFADIQHQQRKLYENSAFVTATLPRSSNTDSPSLHRKKGPNLIKQLKKSLSKSGSFSRDSQPKLAVTSTARRNSRDDDSVSAERNNDSSSFGSRSDTANDSPRLVQKGYYTQIDDPIHESSDSRTLSAIPSHLIPSTSSAGNQSYPGNNQNNLGLPEEYATISRKFRTKKQEKDRSSSGSTKEKEHSSSAKNRFMSKFGGGGGANSRDNSKECLLDGNGRGRGMQMEQFGNLKNSEAPRKSMPNVASSTQSVLNHQVPPTTILNGVAVSTSALIEPVVVRRRHFAVPPVNKHAPNRPTTSKQSGDKKGHRVSWHDGLPQPSISHSSSYHSGLMNRKTFYESGFPTSPLAETTITHSVSTMCPPSNSDGRFPGFIDREFVTTITPQHYQVSPQCEMSEASFTCSLDLRVSEPNSGHDNANQPQYSSNDNNNKKYSLGSNPTSGRGGGTHNGNSHGTSAPYGGYMTPGDASSVAESSSSARRNRNRIDKILRPQSCIGKKSSKMKRTRNSLRGKFENQISSTGGKTIKPRPVTTMDFPEDLDLNSEDFRNQMLGIPSPVPEDDHGSRTPAKGTLKQSRSHPNLRDMINRISTSINPGSSSNLSTSFRSKNKKREKIASSDIHRTNSLERTKSPCLSITIPPNNNLYDPYNDTSQVKPRKRTPGSAHSGERPKSAVTPIGFAAMGLNGRDETDVDDKISLEQFLKESNRSPKSRRPLDNERVELGGRIVPPHLLIDQLFDPTSPVGSVTSMTSPTEVEGGSSPCDDPDPFAPTPPPRTHSTRAGLVPVDHLHMNIKRKYQEAVLNNDKDALREHLSCDEIEDEPPDSSQKSPALIPRQHLIRQRPRASQQSDNQHGSSRSVNKQHRLSQPSPDSTFRSDVEGGAGTSLSGSIGHSPQFQKVMMTSPGSAGGSGHGRGQSPQQRSNPSSVPMARSYHGNLSGSSIGSDVLDRDGASSQGDPSPLKYPPSYSQSSSSWGKAGSRSGIIGSSSQPNPKRNSLESQISAPSIGNQPPVTYPRSSSKHVSSSTANNSSLGQMSCRNNVPSPSISNSNIASAANMNRGSNLAPANRPLPPVPSSPESELPQMENKSNTSPPTKENAESSTSTSEQNKKNASSVWYEYGVSMTMLNERP